MAVILRHQPRSIYCCRRDTARGEAQEARRQAKRHEERAWRRDVAAEGAPRQPCACHVVIYAGDEPWCLCDNAYLDLCGDCS